MVSTGASTTKKALGFDSWVGLQAFLCGVFIYAWVFLWLLRFPSNTKKTFMFMLIGDSRLHLVWQWIVWLAADLLRVHFL